MKTTFVIISFLILASRSTSLPLDDGNSAAGEYPNILHNVAKVHVTPLLLQVPIPAIIVPSPVRLPDSYALWHSLKGLIPNEYFETAIKTRLYDDSKFVAAIFNLALQQIALDLDTLHAKQAVFREYIKCACPLTSRAACTVQELYEDDVDDDSVLREFINPYFATLTPNVDFGVGVRILKLMKFSLAQVEQRHRNLAKTVECSCPHSTACNKKIDHDIYLIITGAKDRHLSAAYWQAIFHRKAVFPTIIPDELLIPLQNAWHNLLENVFGNINPQAPIWGLFGGQLFPNFFNHTAAHVGFNNSTGWLSSIGSAISSDSQATNGTGWFNSAGNVISSASQLAGNTSRNSSPEVEPHVLVPNSSTIGYINTTDVQSTETATATILLASLPIVAEQEINSTTISEQLPEKSIAT